jgi:subtilisin family serine protease
VKGIMLTRFAITLILLLVCYTNPARADQRLIVRSTGGLGVVQRLCRIINCSVVDAIGDPLSQLFTVTVDDGVQLTNLLNGVLTGLLNGLGITVEVDQLLGVINPASALAPASVAGNFFDRRPVTFAGSIVWNGYASQPAANIVRAPAAQHAFGVTGTSIVALIDTEVDSTHPALRNVVLPGYDFVNSQSGTAPQTAGLSQSTTAVVDGGAPARVNGSTIAYLDQSTTAVVDDPGHAGFGHGTMVAGIVHLVAPGALILPLQAFGDDGQGYLSDVLQAVYRAVSSGARVINMSFSTSTDSPDLRNALNFAVSRGLICVAAAGNDGKEILVYPAAYQSSVMGVASTNLLDQRSAFSNYGDELVWVAAPGEGVISTYPFASYAAGWGTSFSAPFVSGTAALLLQAQSATNESSASKAIANAKPDGPNMGNGRLDVYSALQGPRSQ